MDIYWNKHISRCKKDTYHLRLWWKQTSKRPAVERATGKALTADRPRNICVTFPDRVFQIEQGGTQTFFLHIKKLAGPLSSGYWNLYKSNFKYNYRNRIKVICKVDKFKLNKKFYTKKEFEAFPIKSNGNLGKWNYIIYADKNNKKIL